MKKRDKRRQNLISVVLVLVLVMTTLLAAGCNGGAGNGSADGKDAADGIENAVGNGRFFEEEIKLPNGICHIQAFRKLADGNLAMIGAKDREGGYYILNSADGGQKWKKMKVPGTGKEYLPLAAIAADGTAVLLHYMEDGKVSALRVDAAGKASPFSFTLSDAGGAKKDNQIYGAGYDAAGNLIVLDANGSLYTVDADGRCQKAFDTKGAGIYYFSIAGNVLAAVHGEGVMFFDIKKKKALETESVLDDFLRKNEKLRSQTTDNGQPVICSGGTDENDLWWAMTNGIFHFARGGSVMEQLVDGEKTSLSSAEAFLGMAVMNPENFFVAVSADGKDKLLHFSYDKNAKAVAEKELSVYALDDSDYLRQAVRKFEKVNPDISVQLEFGLSDENGVTLDDALSTLNTNILAGKGPDVLILDGMPLDSYIEKGILTDISDIVEEIDQSEGIFPGIKEGSKKDGKIYAMPARFLISIVEGDKDAVASAGTISALAEQVTRLKKTADENVLPPKGTRTLLRDLYYADSATWKKEDGTLDETMLTQYLTDAKEIYEVDAAKKEEDFHNEYGGDGTFEGTKVGTNDSTGFGIREQKISFGSLADMNSLQVMHSVQKKTKMNYALLNSEKVKSYIPYLLAGVTEGENKEMAGTFVRMLLGEQAQNSETEGFPVNRAAYDKLCADKKDAKNEKNELSAAMSTQDGKMFEFNYVTLTEQELTAFTELVESLSEPAMTNRVIQEIVLEQGEKYLQGEQELSQTVNAILQKVNLYLTE